MLPKLIFLVLGILVIHVEGTRMVHRLAGGHKKIYGNLDDAELLITSSAGGGRDKKGQEGGGEEKKTLSQQVADGKYGLIQKELFSKPVKRPGVLSYDSNPEVPIDNADNLGGLSKNDIWLAENHLLVIKGGAYPAHDDNSDLGIGHELWSPIDDYKAPGRQVKIPAHPKVPPPFPVQLYEGGPLQILGTNTTTTLNGSFSAAPYPLSGPEGGGGGFFPPFPSAEGGYPTNFTSGETPFPIPPFSEIGAPPFPLNGSLPPFFASLRPGAAILPPPNNITDQYDEDDPSIYYPPPYSFYYQMDNSTQVPPGPLVPGIVLPPPPNFFAPLEKMRKKSTTTKVPKTRPQHRTSTTTTTTETTKQLRPTTTPSPPTAVNRQKITTIKTTTTTTTQVPTTQRVVTIYPARYVPKNRTYIPPRTQDTRRKKPPAVTVLRPVKPSTTTTTVKPVYFYENNEVKPFKVYGPPSQHRTVISSTQIPLKAYFSTSNEIDTNSVTQAPPENNYYKQQRVPVQIPKTTKAPAQFYYYEEEPVTNSITTERAPKQQYNAYPKEYYAPAKEQARPVYQRPQQQQYYYVNQRPSRPVNTRFRFIETTKKPADTFSVHVARLKQQIHQYYTTPDPYAEYEKGPKPVYQFSFQAANYQSQNEENNNYNPPPSSSNVNYNQRPRNSNYNQAPSSSNNYNRGPSSSNNYNRGPSSSVVNNNFRASPLDDQGDDKFRPNKYAQSNKYSVEIQPAIEVIPSERPPPPRVYQNTPAPVYYEKSTTKRPEIKYYSSPAPDDEYEYEEVEIGNQKERYVATPSPISQYEFQATPNPVYQSYYTKQEEPFFDDITKKYFTIFGKKIPGQTTPINSIEHTTPRPRIPQKNVQIEYAQSVGKEISLQADTLVNYVPNRPRAHDPRAEYVNINPRPQSYLTEQGGLQSDVNINYKQPRPPISPDAELVRTIPVKDSKPSGSFISYELPGDNGAHFYFLTPQLAQRRDQGAGFYYESQSPPSARS